MVKVASSNKLSKAIPIDTKLDIAQKGCNPSTTTITCSRTKTDVQDSRTPPHVLYNDDKMHKHQYNEFQGGPRADSLRTWVITDDKIHVAGQDGRCGTGQNLTTMDPLPPFRNPCLQHLSKCKRNREQLDVVPTS